MPLHEYFLNNFPMLFELIGLLIILFISAHISRRVKTYTRLAVLLLLTSILVTAFEGWTQTFERLSLWRPILTAFKYSLYPLILIDLILLATHSCVLAWRIPGTAEPGGLPSMGVAQSQT